MEERRMFESASEDNDKFNRHDKVKPVQIWELFRYGSCLDLLLVLGGCFTSAIAGAAFPLVVILVAFAVTEFGNLILSDTILGSSSLNGTSYFCNLTSKGLLDYLTSTDRNSLFKNRLYELSYGMLGIAVCLFIGLCSATILWSLVSIRQGNRIKSAFIRAVLNQDASHYDLNPATELPTLLIEDIKNIESAIDKSCGEIVFQISTAVASFVIALVFNWELALVVMSLIFTLIVLLGIMGKVNVSAIEKEHAHLTLAASWAEQIILSIKTVIAYGGQPKEEQRYGGFLRKALGYSYVKSISAAAVFSFFAVLSFSLFSLGFWYGGQLFVSCSGIVIEDIIIVVFSALQVCFSLGYLVLPLTSLGAATVSGANVFAVTDKIPKIVASDDDKKTQLQTFNGSIQLSDIVFSYPSRPEVPILKGIDLDINPGQTVALVGPSGCGKSTIMKLIPRIYEFDGGNVSLDGVDIRELSVKWLRSQIGIVSQEPVLFNVSIAENIGYGKEGATMEEIEAAAEVANAHDFITTALPDGYNTIVGEGGSQISGGQKQRIAIARALVRNPKILLLDEATSALDTRSEKLVQQALDKAKEGRTTIIIAHRLSTIQTADVIVGIDKGCVVEMGSHSELMEKQGLYHGLVMSQMKEDEESDEQKKDFRKEWKKSTRKSTHRSIKKKRFSRVSTSKVIPLPSLLRRQSTTLSIGVLQRQSTTLSIDTGLPRRGSSKGVIELDDVFEDLPLELVEDQEVVFDEQTSYKDIFILVKQDWWLLMMGILSFGLVGVEVSVVYILMSQAIVVFTETDPDVLTDGLEFYVYWYAFLAVVGGIIYFVGVLSLNLAADRLSKRIRSQSFKTILKQEVSFFDRQENSLGNLVLYLVDDPANINQITGIPLGFLSRIVFAAIASVVISLYASWVIAIILLPAYPILVFGTILEIHIGRTLTEKGSPNYSNEIAIEAIENLSTVATLGITEKIALKFENSTNRPARYSMASAAVHGFLYGFSESFILFATAAALAVSGKIFDETGPELDSVSASFNNIFLSVVMFLSIM